MSAKKPTRKPRRPLWFDPRFAIGIVLVLASVGGVYAIVAASDTTTMVYAARSTLIPGDPLQGGDLVAARVRLGSSGGLYLSEIPSDAVVTRTVAAGELVPASAVGERAGEDQTSVVLEVRGSLAAAIVTGSVVDVWSAKQVEHGQFGAPAVIVSRATVVRILKQDGLSAGRDAVSVEVLVPREKIAAVLQSAANGDAVSVVPERAS